MSELSHAEAPLIVGMIFLILLLLVGILIVILNMVEKKNFPDNKIKLKEKHEKLVKKGKLKAAIHLGYSYLKTIKEDQAGEKGLIYFLISQDFYRLGLVSDATYFANIADRYNSAYSDNSSEDIKRLAKDIKIKLVEMEAELPAEDCIEITKKIKLFDEQEMISYPHF